MIGAQPDLRVSPLAFCRVVGYDASTHRVYIDVPSTQQIGIPVQILQIGAADAMRVNQEALPIRGTWGVVAFLNNDTRTAVWLGAIHPSNWDAFTSSQPPQDTDTQIEYHAHFSGYFDYRDFDGNYVATHPDGTTIRVNTTNTTPTIYRHVDSIITNLDVAAGNKVAIVYTPQDRRAVPHNPFFVSLTHSSGLSVTITPSGDIKIVGAKNNGAVLEIDPIGVITVQSGVSSSFGSSSIVMDVSGNVNILSSGKVAITATQGDISTNTSSHVDSINTIINTYNAHTHSGVQAGPSNTGPPIQILP